MTVMPTILVVEDNPTTRKMLCLALMTEGYAVVEAADARTALAAAEGVLPDLVLQDLILPDMDGIELLRRLRGLPGGPELPILALSGFLSRLEEAQTDRQGFTALLVKPIEPSRLIEAIRVYLRPHAVPAAYRGEDRRLLVVDDDPIQLKLTRLHFSHLGFDVSVAGGASDALVAARAHPPDVVLSDVFMPGTDGFDLCLEIRRDPDLAHVPVVLLSGQYGSEADEDLARRVGASALILRTPDFEKVAPAILTALQTRAPTPAEQRSEQLDLTHARLVIHQLERQVAATAGLAQRCGIQAGELSLLSGVADALTRKSDPDLALRDVLAATLDAAGISKGALILRNATGVLELRQAIGFSDRERSRLQDFFGHAALLDEIVERGGSASVPSSAIPDGTSRTILAGAGIATAHIVPLISDGRGVGAMVIGATSTDVTSDDSVAFARAMGNQVVQSLELARSVSRLAASEQRYRTLLESANDFIAVLTRDGIVREVNHRWVEFTGLPVERLIGRHVREFAPPGKENQTILTYAEAASTSRARTPPVEIARPDGSIAFIEFSSTNVDVGGEPLIFTIGRDVTERRLLEAQYQQAQKMEAVGRLAGGVAHDFNNLLTAILGYCELLLADVGQGDPRAGDIVEIQKAGTRASGLTRQLLAFSRKQIIEPTLLDLNTIVADMRGMLGRLIGEDVKIVVSLLPNLAPVKADRGQVEQVVMNLAVNARDAMPKGGTLTIDTANVELDEHYAATHLDVNPGPYVALTVSDTGTGMTPAVQARLFEPFFTTKEAGKGTGLGTATVYGIVTRSGGNVGVYSELGKGTSFKVYFPKADAVEPAAETAAPVARPRVGSHTVLVVEDEEGLRELAKRLLQRLGYTVLIAADAAEARRVFTANPAIDILLTDVVMPGASGPELTLQLIEQRPALKVIYMSGYTEDAIVQHGVLRPGIAFLNKPFTSYTLGQKIRETLER
jgi:PAS domain S-box-containing protein